MGWLDQLFDMFKTSSPADQQPRSGLPYTGGGGGAGQAEAVGPAGGNPAPKGAMSSDFAKILAATLLATPALTYPRNEAARAAAPFAYAPTVAQPLAPRMAMGR